MKHIAIFGVPRSGTSWLGQIFNSSEYVAYRYQPIFSYTFPFSIEKDSDKEDINKFHEKLLETDDPFVCQKQNISGNKTPDFHKKEITHLVWKEVRYLETMETLLSNSDTKIIGIVRHPCGVLKSWMKAPKEFDDNWDIMKEWQFAKKKNTTEHDYYGFEKWIESTVQMLMLQEKFSSRFRLVTYEDLLKDTFGETIRLFEYCKIPFSNQVKGFINDSTSKSSDDPYDVYRSNKRSDEWKEVLPSDIVEGILNDERFINIQKDYK
ncbi:sulfotransferase domain-containing protein [Gracilimonas sediminicola]|uniref:sulfotransferase domain-containing protein n=1 Tax=Gracilimonas sediminicola TaxID=2952158 RepID=UPI0038D3F800